MQTRQGLQEYAADCNQSGTRHGHGLVATLVAVWIALGSHALASAFMPVVSDMDFGFYTNALNNSVTCLAVQTNGQVLVGGQLTTVNGVATVKNVCATTAGTVAGAYLGVPGSGVLLVLDSSPDQSGLSFSDCRPVQPAAGPGGVLPPRLHGAGLHAAIHG